MDTKSTNSFEAPAIDAIEDMVSELLDQGLTAFEISFGLAAVAMELGLHLAPSSEAAIVPIMDAIGKTAAHHALANSESQTNPESGDEPESDADAVVDPQVFGTSIH